MSPQWSSKKEREEGVGWPEREGLLYRSPDNNEEMIEEIHLENHHSAISKIMSESGKTHQKMFKPFGEMLLGAGDVQGAKGSPLRLHR